VRNYFIFLCSVMLIPQLQAAEMRDPTRPGNWGVAALQNQPLSAMQPESAPMLDLTEIRISDHSRRAVINKQIVRIGETLADGSTVLSIRRDHVVVRRNGVNNSLTLIPSVKHPVK
jgi:type II secretory pathway component PulC